MAAALLFSSLLACGAQVTHPDGGSAGDGGALLDAGAPLTADGACTDSAAGLCAMMRRCMPFATSYSFASDEVCAQRTKLSCLRSLAEPGTALSPARQTTCAATMASLSCDAVYGGAPPAECQGAGSVSDGAACQDGDQCASTFCRKASGGACGVCAHRRATGATCVPADADCPLTDVCVKGSSGTSTCVTRGAPGATCSATQPCGSQLFCRAGSCSPVATTAGAPCLTTQSGACSSVHGLQCDGATSTCQPFSVAQVGQPCGMVAGKYVFCGGGGSCNAAGTAPGTCVAALDDGAPCGTAMGSARCLLPATCVGGLCTLPVAGACQ